MKLALMFGDVWIMGFILLTFLSFSRLLFDTELKEHHTGRFALFVKRIGIALVWPLAICSGGGRRIILVLMKGE